MLHKFSKLLFSGCLLLLLVMGSGCLGPNFVSLAPDQGGEYSREITGESPDDGWFWIRGRATGDLDGKPDKADRPVEEEALLMTLQRGPRDDPGPTPGAWLVVVRINPDTGQRSLVARTGIFSVHNDNRDAKVPDHALMLWSDGLMDDGRIEIFDIDGDGISEILVSLWRKTPADIAALHRLYRFENDSLREIFSVRVVQSEPKVGHQDLDMDGVDELIVPMSVLPPRLPDAVRPRPSWPAVYGLDVKSGRYVQDNAAYPQAYEKPRLAFYEDMLQDNPGNPVAEHAVHSYCLGLMYRYFGDDGMSNLFLRRAAAMPGTVGRQAREELLEAGSETDSMEKAPPEKDTPKAEIMGTVAPEL